ncbi:MAG: hypothetical protein HQL65_12220 [Magnetococcales bacterium]|nr:hypothetical protein [Magnetococcales bacterium]
MKPISIQQPRYQALIGLGVALIVILLTIHVPQGVGFDPSIQVLSVDQYLKNISPSPNHYLAADQNDLSRDQLHWIHNWPPGTQLFVLPLMSMGLDIGTSLRILSVACVLLGAMGWALWFGKFNIPGIVGLMLSCYVPCLRFTNNYIFSYNNAEILVFALAPWLLLGSWHVTRPGMVHHRIFLSCILGFGCGMAYVFKFSGAFIAGPALGFLWLTAMGRWFSHQQDNLFKISILGTLTCLLPILVWSFLNLHYGGYVNQFDALYSPGKLNWSVLVRLFTYPALCLGDADALWNYLLLHPDHGIFHPSRQIIQGIDGSFVVNLIGIPGGILFLMLLARPGAWQGPGKLGILSIFLGMLGLLIVWANTHIGYLSTYLQVTTFAVFPVLIREGVHIWQSPREKRWWRMTLAMGGAFYLLIPMGYGLVSMAGKIVRIQPDYKVASSGLFNPFLSSTTRSPVDVVAELTQKFNPKTDIWFTPNVNIRLDLPGRALMVSDWIDVNDWRKIRFHTSQPLRVLALIPKATETGPSGKGQAIRDAFVDAKTWEHVPLATIPLDLWIGQLDKTLAQ